MEKPLRQRLLAAFADEIVVATTGGLMRNTLEEHMYKPFQEATGTEVIPFDIEVPDQWARAEGMVRSGNVEFDIVTATGPDLVDKAELLLDIPCDTLAKVKALMGGGPPPPTMGAVSTPGPAVPAQPAAPADDANDAMDWNW